MQTDEMPFRLTDEQFEKLARWVDAAAMLQMSRAVQQNSVLLGVAERAYVVDREAAKRALVGEA